MEHTPLCNDSKHSPIRSLSIQSPPQGLSQYMGGMHTDHCLTLFLTHYGVVVPLQPDGERGAPGPRVFPGKGPRQAPIKYLGRYHRVLYKEYVLLKQCKPFKPSKPPEQSKKPSECKPFQSLSIRFINPLGCCKPFSQNPAIPPF
jgi:hypothetical protein